MTPEQLIKSRIEYWYKSGKESYCIEQSTEAKRFIEELRYLLEQINKE